MLPEIILRLPAVKAATGLSRSTIYERISAGTFTPEWAGEEAALRAALLSALTADQPAANATARPPAAPESVVEIVPDANLRANADETKWIVRRVAQNAHSKRR